MTSKTKSASVLVLSVLFLLPACSQRLGDLTIASNKNIDVGTYSPNAMEAKDIKGKDCKPVILFIPTGVPDIEAAIDDAFQKSSTNLMTDAVITRKWWTALVFSQNCFEVEGKGWQVDLASLSDEELERLADGSEGTSMEVRTASGETIDGELIAVADGRWVIREGETLHRLSLGEISSVLAMNGRSLEKAPSTR